MPGASDKEDHSERCSFCTCDVIDLGSIAHIKFTLTMSDTKNMLCHWRRSLSNIFSAYLTAVILMSRWTCRVQGIKRDIEAGNMGGNFTVHLLYFVATRTHVHLGAYREWRMEGRDDADNWGTSFTEAATNFGAVTVVCEVCSLRSVCHLFPAM